jgi:AcrR family transcriptional regulator
MGTAERRERERFEVREKILAAAHELFVERGYEAVTMRGIADAIEYSPTAIYFHFKDKETLIRELCQRDFIALAQKFVEIAEIGDPLERLREIGRAYVRFGFQHPEHYRFMFMASLPPASDPQAQGRGDPGRDGYAFLRAAVEEAIRSGGLRDGFSDAELVSQTLWAGMHGLVSLHISMAHDGWIDWRPLDARIESLLDALLHGVAERPAQAPRRAGTRRRGG